MVVQLDGNSLGGRHLWAHDERVQSLRAGAALAGPNTAGRSGAAWHYDLGSALVSSR